jgi:nucleotide-binding universal stress UspA family protein
MTGPIERIVLPLDAASETHTSIDTAVRLAARVKAPLHGVFVEDEDLLRLAGLPFARQVTLGTGSEPFTTETVELHLRAAAERVKTELFAAAKQHRVECTFEVVRGTSEIAVSSASARDLVVAGALTRPIAGHFRVECRWWSSLEAAVGPFLLARNTWGAPGSLVMILRDRSPAAERLFAAAAQLATVMDSVLTVICPPIVASEKGFEKWLADRVAEHPVRIQIEIATIEQSALHERLDELDCRVLAFEAGLAEGSGDGLRNIVDRLACDILVVR